MLLFCICSPTLLCGDGLVGGYLLIYYSFVCICVCVCVFTDWQKWRTRTVHSSRTASLLMKACEYAAAPTQQPPPPLPDTLTVAVFVCALGLAHACLAVREGSQKISCITRTTHREQPVHSLPLHRPHACCSLQIIVLSTAMGRN